MRVISRLHVHTIAVRLLLLRRTAAQEKMNADETAWYQHGADTRFLSCPDADTRHRPRLIIHYALQWRPRRRTSLGLTSGHTEELGSGVCRSVRSERHQPSLQLFLPMIVAIYRFSFELTDSRPSFSIIEIPLLALRRGNAEDPANSATPGNSRLGWAAWF